MAKRKSRLQEWADAATDAMDAVSILVDLQSDYESWRDNLPENFGGTALAEKLDAVVDLDLQSALDVLTEANDIELPQGFGRD